MNIKQLAFVAAIFTAIIGAADATVYIPADTVGGATGTPLYQQGVHDGVNTSQANPLPTVPPDGTSTPWTWVTGGNTVIATLDMHNKAAVSVTLDSTTGVSMFFWYSNDNTTYYPQNCIRNDMNSSATGAGFLDGWTCPRWGNYFQLRVSGGTAAAGSITAMANPGVAPTAVLNTIQAQIKPAVQTGLSLSAVNSTTTTNAHLITSGLHLLYGYHLCNGGTADGFLRFFDASSTPTPGTTTPIIGAIDIPKGSCVNGSFADIGATFASGIGYDITAAQASGDATSLTSATVVTGWVSYN